jgi:outer membrane protein OmpA-like peptidoglycan-associated protein
MAAYFGVLGMVLTMFALSGCATGPKLRARADEINALNQSIEQRAYRCAPRELALAESNREFGEYELDQGNFVRAKKHLMIAEENARLADQMSDFDECRDTRVAMKVEATPKAEVVEAKKTPKDRDGDNIPDEPEDFDSFKDEDGCPEPDNDGDGVLDEADNCPDVPEDQDGFADSDGCPDFDNDTDGIADLNDSCKDQAEDFDNFQDEDGCPETDNDGDAIADILDNCVNEPEDYDGDQDTDGCPEERKLIKIEGDQIKLGQKIFFKTNKATILPKSYDLLNEVASVLVENPSINIRIEGHTDSKGSDSYNLKLSRARAASVLDYLEGQGVDRSRMESVGFGEERPIEDNATETGRAANRRVEIHITSK